jgi:CubicO group peptidase (beta-lactamase class C family)
LSEGFPLQVSTHLFMSKNLVDSIYKQIFTAPLGASSYKYSDVGYYLFQDIIQNHYNKTLDAAANDFFYAPLGATTLTYNPLQKMSKDAIPPTEEDKYFRFEKIQGYVHDQGAAMMGGVAGHAGLFSNATDLAKLMQMYMQFGEYGGRRYVDSATVAEFIRCQFCDKNNRRGVGFDRPTGGESGPTCNCVSMLSFGHTGFTGTIAWSDPKDKIVYIFLSNRTWPDAENKKLIQMNTRSNIQQVIYDALNTYQK